jgi:hypothetical protein
MKLTKTQRLEVLNTKPEWVSRMHHQQKQRNTPEAIAARKKKHDQELQQQAQELQELEKMTHLLDVFLECLDNPGGDWNKLNPLVADFFGTTVENVKKGAR